MSYRIMQQKRNITVLISQNNKQSWMRVKAQTLIVYGYEQFVLAVHKDVLNKKTWTVTELCTGKVTAKGKTRKAACEAIEATINRIGSEKYSEFIVENMKGELNEV